MSRWVGIVAAVLIVLAIVLLFKVGPTTGGVEHFRQQLLSYGPWAVLISTGIMIAQAIIAPLPANVVTITNGLVFGPLWGALLSWVTTLIGASLCYFLSKTFGKPFAEKIVGDSVHKAEHFFTRFGLQAMFIVRIVPFVPFDAISYGAGLIGVPYTSFIIATSIGIIPSILVYSYIGSVAPHFYWWILMTMLGVSLVGIVCGIALYGRKRAKPLLNPAAQAQTKAAA